MTPTRRAEPMKTWLLRRRGLVAVLTFSRPPENYMDFASLITLGNLLDELGAETDVVRVVLLASGVDGFFINHAEPEDLVRAGSGEMTTQEGGSWARALGLLEAIPQPTIAAIDGLASGGGNELALACTLRICSERARLQQPEVSIGIIPGGGGSVRLPRLVGPGVAAEAVLTGRAFDPEEARRAGWVNAILPAHGFSDHALHWAEAVAANPGSALNAAKKSIVLGSRMAFTDALSLEHELFNQLTATSTALTKGMA